MNQASDTTPTAPQAADAVESRRIDPVAAALTASAFVLAALFITTVGGVFNQPAYARAAVSSGGTALVSMEANVNDDIVVTLDESTGTLRTFGVGIGGGRSKGQYDRYDLRELFQQAARGGGRGR